MKYFRPNHNCRLPRIRFFFLMLMALSIPVSADGQTAFTDLANHVAEQPAITSMVRQGIMRGVSQTQFDPDASVTRGDFVESMQRMFDLQAPVQKINFQDVSTSSEIYVAVQAVAPFLGRQMRCFGCSLGLTFGPNEPISRLEMAVTLTNILIATNKVALLSPTAAEAALAGVLDTATLRGPVREYVATALQHGVIARTSSNTLAPDLHVTRADLAVQLDGVQKKFNIPQLRP